MKKRPSTVRCIRCKHERSSDGLHLFDGKRWVCESCDISDEDYIGVAYVDGDGDPSEIVFPARERSNKA